MTMLASTLFSVRDRGELGAMRAALSTASLGKRWFLPASLLTLVFGAITTALGNLWDQPWIILGLAGAAATFLTGILVFEPTARKLAELMAEGREAEALVAGRTMLRISKFDYTVMFLIVADMVLKPDWSSYTTLGAMAAILVAGAVAFLIMPKRAVRPIAA